MNKKVIFSKGINSFTLHILAMAFMVADHLWNIFFPNQIWLNVLGRLAFPIFAFMLVEGFFRTKNRKKYLIRIFIFAAISEIPFNLFASLALRGEIMVFYPYNNVLWTFGIALCGMNLLEKTEKSENLNKIIKFFVKAAISILTIVIAHFARSDYLGYGIAIILIFYFFRGKDYKNIIFQAVLMVFLNVFIMPGLEFPFNFFGNFLPFYGYDYLSFGNYDFLKGELSFSYRFYKRNYIKAIANIANANDNMFAERSWFSKPKYTGYALGLSSDTILGPIEIKATYSPETDKFLWLFNIGFLLILFNIFFILFKPPVQHIGSGFSPALAKIFSLYLFIVYTFY